MKIVLVVLAFFAFCALCGLAIGAIDRPRKRPLPPLDVAEMLGAIADVESGNKEGVVGTRGERGRCQFMPETWRRYTDAKFEDFAPINCQFTRKIERAHLSYICGYLTKRRLPLDPALIAAAWRFGEGKAERYVQSDSAQRTANIYFDRLERKARAGAVAQKGRK